MNAPSPGPAHVLMLVADTIGKHRRTGIQRVVIETARALAGRPGFDLVRWDWLEGRLRFLDAEELDGLFGAGAWPEGIAPRAQSRRVGRPFSEELAHPEDSWLLIPEVGWHAEHGLELMARAIAHCRAWGGRSVGVFYDLIPIRNAAYGEWAQPHEAYLAELVKTDLIVSISQTSADELEGLWRDRGIAPHPPIAALLLPDGGFERRNIAVERERLIVLLGTVEPRKRQVDFLQAMERARSRSAEVAGWNVVVIGSVHGAVAQDFQAIIKRSPWLSHPDYIADDAVAELLARAGFTVFASDDEGYGLPISESLAAGTPCLCANFGSMAEIAQGGGCLTVDVRDAAQLEAATIALCVQPETLERLRSEIARRRFETWDHYASAFLGLMQSQPRLTAHKPPRAVVAPDGFATGPVTDSMFESLATADIAAFAAASGIAGFVAEAERRAWPALLPPAVLAGELDREIDTLARARTARLAIAESERGFAIARRALGPDAKTRPVFLRVLISTYNRADFVTANARWILRNVFPKGDESYELVVVDGASTDDTVQRLKRIADRRLKVIDCPVNVGMLAGLREAARMPGAEYVWLVGDDDFIDPDAFRDIFQALKANAGLPFAFTNFSVYHRATMGAGDMPSRLVLESRPVAERVAPSGVMPVYAAAAQTDNLFTAIYTIIWRADVLSAAYEIAYDGAPFAGLAEAIPCTEFILGHYGACDAYWRARPGIAGNAHNSWSRHRPRWHGIIMPLAIDLAAGAGVDRVKLQAWARTHRTLLNEAMDIGAQQGWSVVLDADKASLALRVFRDLPEGFEAL